jgi:ribosome biogenesis GTPase / thiamine phosphate phosphatase
MIDINFDSLRAIGLTSYIAQQLLMLETRSENSTAARVIEVHRDQVMLHNGTIPFRARVLPSLTVNLAVGDWVLVEKMANGECWINNYMEPLTQITRRNTDGNKQVLVSNVDTALLVMGLDHDFNLRRLERYLAIVQAAKVEPLIVLTKADIAENIDEKIDQLTQRLPHHLPRFTVNALAPQTAIELASWLTPGQTLVLLGSSGAGKSTLTNTLTSSQQVTGDVREGDSRGRHTTTARSLHQSVSGACIIDTPGLRTWSPDIDEESLSFSFEDIQRLAMDCRFRDCQHQSEPGCAVRDNVDADRLQNYHKLLREVRRSHQTALDKINERAKWKSLHKAMRVKEKHK